MTMNEDRFLWQADVVPHEEGARSGPTIYVLVSLNFPDMTTQTADFMCRSSRSALKALADRDIDWRLVDTSDHLPQVVDVARGRDARARRNAHPMCRLHPTSLVARQPRNVDSRSDHRVVGSRARL
jgi:hypothetical protein